MLRLLVKNVSSSSSLQAVARRHIGVTAYVSQKPASSGSSSDPVQKLFLDKLREYNTNAKKIGGEKLVDVTPQFEQKMVKETDALKRRFGSGDMEQFPKFDFTEK